ncbi:MAG: outer membrane protein assembly factor BamD [Gemmatimonadota bacterium]
MTDARTALVLTGVVAAFAACATPKPPDVITSPDLFDWAQTHFDEENYAAARNGFERFLLSDPLSPMTDSAQYMLAEAQLRFGQEVEAAEGFSRLSIGRPNSRLADDAQLGVCRAYYAASPRVTLSQEYTNRAIIECQRLLQFFPASDLRPQAEALLDQARGKLAEKSFVLGKYYFDRKFYESANVYFEKAMSERPSPELMPRLLAMMWDSYTLVGFDTEARVVRDRLYEEFPDSPEADRVRREDGDRQ